MKANNLLIVCLCLIIFVTMLTCKNNAPDYSAGSVNPEIKHIYGCDYYYEVDIAIYENDYQSITYWKCDTDNSTWSEVKEYSNLEELPRFEKGYSEFFSCNTLDSQAIRKVPKKMAVLRHYILVSKTDTSGYDIAGLETSIIRSKGYPMTDFFIFPKSLHDIYNGSGFVTVFGWAHLAADREMTKIIPNKPSRYRNPKLKGSDADAYTSIQYEYKAKPNVELGYRFDFSINPSLSDEMPTGFLRPTGFDQSVYEESNLSYVASQLVESDADSNASMPSEILIPITDLSFGFENTGSSDTVTLMPKKCGWDYR